MSTPQPSPANAVPDGPPAVRGGNTLGGPAFQIGLIARDSVAVESEARPRFPQRGRAPLLEAAGDFAAGFGPREDWESLERICQRAIESVRTQGRPEGESA